MREKRAEQLILVIDGDHSRKCGRQGAKGTTRFSQLILFTRCREQAVNHALTWVQDFMSPRVASPDILLKVNFGGTSTGWKALTKPSI